MIKRGLGTLPESLVLERSFKGKRILDPGAGVIPEWTNNYRSSNYPFTIGLTSLQIVPANPLRCYLLIQNKNAASDMFINFGSKATTDNGIIIIPRGNYEFVGGAVGGDFSPGNSVWLLGAVAAMKGVLVEGVLPPVIPI